MKRTHAVSRRNFLIGTAGATVALPFLETFSRTAHAAGGDPLRYVIVAGGVEQLNCQPSGTGAGYTMPAGLASLEEVRDHITLVSGLEIPRPDGTGPVPPGGKTHSHHGDVMMPLFTGYRTPDDYAHYTSASSDQIVAERLAEDSPFASLQFRAQPIDYKGGNGGSGGSISVGPGGSAKTPYTSPRLAWEQLAQGVAPDDADPAELAAQMRRIEQQQSMLDLVLDRGNALKQRVSSSDRIVLEEHFDRIRDLEKRLTVIGGGGGAACDPIPDPGPDPATSSHQSTAQGGTVGYSDEDVRAEVFADLLFMALACDLTRVATLQTTMEQSFMSVEPMWGVAYEMHDITHEDDIPDRDSIWDSINAWHARFYARLVANLAAAPQGQGTMLDNTVCIFTNTGGRTAHSTLDMTMAVAGCPDVLRIGEHIRPAGAHPGHVFQTAMHAVGVDEDFGELPGLVDALLL